MKIAAVLLSSFLLICLSVPVLAFTLPDSDQRKCYMAIAPYTEISCSGTGQDGEYVINPLSYTDNGDGTVTDNNTSLIWQQLLERTTTGDLKTYNWYQASGTYHPTYNVTGDNACGSLTLGGYGDWRLPTKMELSSIVNYAPATPPLIETTFFPEANITWTATVSPSDLAQAWYVNFGATGNGISVATTFNKTSKIHARCVRGQSVGGRPNYVDNGDLTVTDTSTGLVWEKSGYRGNYNVGIGWSDALSYCAALELAGQNDWRLPNVRELEYLTSDPSYNDIFMGTLWALMSSTTKARYLDQIYEIGDTYYEVAGDSSIGYRHKSLDYTVKCVRGGLSENPICQRYVIQPGPEGKDTYYGTVYNTSGEPSAEWLGCGGWGDWYYDFLEFDLAGSPSADETTSARLYLYGSVPNDPGFQVNRITQPWEESGISQNNEPASEFYMNFGPFTVSSNPASFSWNFVDISELYKAWKNGTYSNYGIKLVPTSNDHTNGSIASSDNGDSSIRPKIVVEYGCNNHVGYDVSGRIRMISGLPLHLARVKLFTGGTLIRTVSTNSRGKYILTDLVPGSYVLKARKLGYYFNPGKRNISITGSNLIRQNFRAYPR